MLTPRSISVHHPGLEFCEAGTSDSTPIMIDLILKICQQCQQSPQSHQYKIPFTHPSKPVFLHSPLRLAVESRDHSSSLGSPLRVPSSAAAKPQVRAMPVRYSQRGGKTSWWSGGSHGGLARHTKSSWSAKSALSGMLAL